MSQMNLMHKDHISAIVNIDAAPGRLQLCCLDGSGMSLLVSSAVLLIQNNHSTFNGDNYRRIVPKPSRK